MAGQHIFVTNDDALYLELIVDALRAAGYQQVTSLAHTTAYQAIRQGLPDLVLLDINETHPSPGWRLLDILRIHPAMRPIPVLLSVFDQSSLTGKELLMQEMDCYVLFKPFDQARLVSLVQTIIGPPAP